MCSNMLHIETDRKVPENFIGYMPGCFTKLDSRKWTKIYSVIDKHFGGVVSAWTTRNDAEESINVTLAMAYSNRDCFGCGDGFDLNDPDHFKDWCYTECHDTSLDYTARPIDWYTIDECCLFKEIS